MSCAPSCYLLLLLQRCSCYFHSSGAHVLICSYDLHPLIQTIWAAKASCGTMKDVSLGREDHNKDGISSKQGKSVLQVKKEGGVWGNIAWREQGHAGHGWIQGKSTRQVKKEGGVWGRVMSPMRT